MIVNRFRSRRSPEPRRFVVACACAAAFARAAAPAAAAIHTGDQLVVHVYNHPDISGAFKVDSRGTIQVPVAGTIRVAGRSSDDVKRDILRRIAPVVPYPAVDVTDQSEVDSLFVSGGPGGVLPYAPGETLATAVSDVQRLQQRNVTGTNLAAQSVTDQIDRSRIDLRRVGIVRDGRFVGAYDVVAMRRSGSPGPALFANDTVAFRDKPVRIDVTGEVATPGAAYLWPDEPITDAIDQLGGVTGAAANSHLTLARENEPAESVTLGDPLLKGPARSGDSLFIPTAPRVSVLGLVYNPGLVTLRNDFTLVSAMYNAGGISKWANIKNVQLTRAGVTTHYDVTELTHGNQTVNPTLQDGDVVYVPEGRKIDYSQVFAGLFTVGNFVRYR